VVIATDKSKLVRMTSHYDYFQFRKIRKKSQYYQIRHLS